MPFIGFFDWLGYFGVWVFKSRVPPFALRKMGSFSLPIFIVFPFQHLFVS